MSENVCRFILNLTEIIAANENIVAAKKYLKVKTN